MAINICSAIWTKQLNKGWVSIGNTVITKLYGVFMSLPWVFPWDLWGNQQILMNGMRGRWDKRSPGLNSKCLGPLFHHAPATGLHIEVRQLLLHRHQRTARRRRIPRPVPGLHPTCSWIGGVYSNVFQDILLRVNRFTVNFWWYQIILVYTSYY